MTASIVGAASAITPASGPACPDDLQNFALSAFMKAANCIDRDQGHVGAGVEKFCFDVGLHQDPVDLEVEPRDDLSSACRAGRKSPARA